jgi:hypothetical protein
MNDEILIELGEVSEETKGCPKGTLESTGEFNLRDPIEPPCD